MPINIKNERVSRTAQELADLTGESIADAVGHAIEEKLARIRERALRRGIADKLMALGEKCAKHAPEGWRTHDYESALFDDQGLPK